MDSTRGRGRGAALASLLRSRPGGDAAEQSEDAPRASTPTPSVDAPPPTAAVPSPAPSTINSPPQPAPSTIESPPQPTSTPGGAAAGALPMAGRGRASRLLGLVAARQGESPAPGKASSQVSEDSAPPTRELKELSLSSGAATTTAVKPPPKLYHGKAGKPVHLSANFLKLEIEPERGIFEYEVTFNPIIDNVGEKYECLKKLEEMGKIKKARTYNGDKLLFFPGMQPSDEETYTVKSSFGERSVTIKFQRQRRMSDPDCIFFYNILFRRVMSALKMVQWRRNFYSSTSAIQIPAHKLEVWPGFVTSVEEFEGGVLLQCDTTHRVLRTETAHEVIRSVSVQNPGKGQNEAVKALVGEVVLTRYNNKLYRIDDVDWEMNPLSTFPSAGKEVKFVDYFRERYGQKIVDLKQPLLVSQPRRKLASDPDNLRIMLVPELVTLTGLTEKMRSDFRVMKDVGTHTRVTPEQRQQALRTFLQNIESNAEAKGLLSCWGLKVSTQTIPLQGRLFEPSYLHFGKGYKEVVGPTADWTRTATTRATLTPVDLKHWTIVYVERDKAIAQAFCKVLNEVSKKIGICVSLPKPSAIPNDRVESYLKAIRESISADTQLVMTIVPQQRADRYAAIKKICCIDMPVASQVIVQKTIARADKLNSVAQKIALQINCKLGGELWGLTTSHKGLMAVGIDVFHDTTGKSASVVGFTASMNDAFSRWFSTTCIQGTHKELVDALEVAMKNALQHYHGNHGDFPKTIVVFRDGIGDSQLSTAAMHEVRQLEECLAKVKTGYKPGFVFIVVQKRIMTRLYAVAGQNNFSNPLPGTVVDHTITRYDWYDFFLVSQKVNQGTVSPTHFVVLRDDSRIPPDEMQRLSYQLTHMYYNWPGTVRVPAPCQYAHKLCTLVGEHLHHEASSTLQGRLYYL